MGTLAIVGALALSASSASSNGSTTATSATDTSAPYATADPSVTSLVDAVAALGRLPLDERSDRRVRTVRGLGLPIEGAALPTEDELLPNAPREFRAGWHEGIDFPAPNGEAVRAVARGTVVRIDREFEDWSRQTQDAALAQAVALGYTPAATLDRIRGRQVWIDHGRGIVSRYAHLSAVAELALGATVERGQVLGAVGSSGFEEGGPHLHLEVRVGTSYLGDGLAEGALRRTIEAAFD
jgi:murein DD-endopeptidase MepM/ murein hydrolase activator NlpD